MITHEISIENHKFTQEGEAFSVLPRASDISRIANQFFPHQESCLDTTLFDEETKKWVLKEEKTVKELKILLSSPDYAADLLNRVKEKARELAKKQIHNYAKDKPINRASLIAYPEQKYILTHEPNEIKELKWFWKNAIEFNIKNIVAAIRPKENEDTHDHSLAYCNKALYPLKIDDEWTIDLIEETIFAKSDSVKRCEVIKRTFVFYSNQQKPKNIHHYHYQGWKNKKGAPDPKLLAKLCFELGNQETKESPIMVHCACGRGRSGNVVLADIIRRRIAEQLKHSSLEDVKLNIVEILFQGRFMRDGFIETPEQITSAFESAYIQIF